MMSLARVPCTIVTGFLGSGKTTLIRHVLANANGRRLAVIVNEFGDVGIDGEILKGCGDASCPEENIVEETLHRRLLPGDGDADVAELIRVLDAGGCTAPLGVEVFSDDLGAQPPEDIAKRSAEATRQVLARARVTVRTNIDRLVGGATEETIIARVGEGIVSSIGSSATHKDVLENPDMISKTVLSKSLDSGTAFEILSIDIADVDVGDNIGARLQTDQAEADLQVARAKAEERRAAAVALEQEMLAAVQQQRARVVEAEAMVPTALAEAFRNGQLGVMDSYNMRNTQADTQRRPPLDDDHETGSTEKM